MRKIPRRVEFYCPGCVGWCRDVVHRPDHHHDYDEVDDETVERWRVSNDGGETWVEMEEEPTDDTVAVLTRENHFNGHGLQVPFSWLYSVTIDGVTTTIDTNLEVARGWAGDRADRVTQEWDSRVWIKGPRGGLIQERTRKA